jgi:hypothetical protein
MSDGLGRVERNHLAEMTDRVVNRKMKAIGTAAALNGRLHQKDATAVTPIAKSAVPTSN